MSTQITTRQTKLHSRVGSAVYSSIDFIQSQASYAAQSLNKYNGDRESVVKKLNDSGIFMGYAIFEINNNIVSVSNQLEEVTVWGGKR